MKKLTKRVNAGGLWFDVHQGTEYLAFDRDGEVFGYDNKPEHSPDGTWEGSYPDAYGYVDLEGADWRECYWYVGEQTYSEESERREWMARGVESIEKIASEHCDTDCIMDRHGISYEDAELRANGAQELAGEIAAYAAKIRSGEVDL